MPKGVYDRVAARRRKAMRAQVSDVVNADQISTLVARPADPGLPSFEEVVTHFINVVEMFNEAIKRACARDDVTILIEAVPGAGSEPPHIKWAVRRAVTASADWNSRWRVD